MFKVDFGRAVTTNNPLTLFTITGSSRVDVVYSKDLGQLYVLATMSDPSEPGVMEFEIPTNSTSSAEDGSTNEKAFTYASYAPEDQIDDWAIYGYVVGWTMFGVTIASICAAALTPTVSVAVGAMNFVGLVQVVYLVGSLPIVNMPYNYKAAADALSWVGLNPAIGPISSEPANDPVATSILMDSSVSFPSFPIEVKSVAEVEPPVADGPVSATPDIVAEAPNAVEILVPLAENDTLAPPDSPEAVTSETPPAPPVRVIIEIPEQDVLDVVPGTPPLTPFDSRPPPPPVSPPSPEKKPSPVPDKTTDSPTPSPSPKPSPTPNPSPKPTPSPSPSRSPPPPVEKPVKPAKTPSPPPPSPKATTEDTPVKYPSPPPPIRDPPAPSPPFYQPKPSPPYEKPSPSPPPPVKDTKPPMNQEKSPSPPPPVNSKPSPSPSPPNNNPSPLPPIVIRPPIVIQPPILIKPPNINVQSPTITLNNSPNPSPGTLDSGNLVAGNGRRRSLAALEDPVQALSSSGFSYTVVTATLGEDVNSTASVGEYAEQSVGSSFLSRIRAIRDAGDSIPDADSMRLDTLWNVLFWSAIAVAAVGMLHAAIVLLLVKVKKVVELPKMLHFPRLELIVFMVVLPMICAAGSACLQSSSPGTLAAGACLGILLPFGFIIAASAFLVFFVVRPSIEDRKAYYIVCEAFEAGDALLTETTIDGDADQDMSSSSSGGNSKLTFEGIGATEATEAGARVGDVEANVGTAGQDHTENRPSARPTPAKFTIRRFGRFAYQWILAPVFGFDSEYRANVRYENVEASHPVWVGRSKPEATRVKRFGCFFEDAHGPQVFRVVTNFLRQGKAGSNDSDINGDTDANDDGPSVFISAEHSETYVEVLQTFGVVFALTKMTLFAAIVNAAGGVNNLAQVVALVVVSFVHIAYLRLFVPYRLRIELAAEIIASTCDFAVFICGIVLIAVTDWTTSMGTSMGIAMLVLQAVGFLVFISVRVALAIRTSLLTVLTRRGTTTQ